MKNKLEEYDWWELAGAILNANKRHVSVCNADTCPSPYACKNEHYLYMIAIAYHVI